MSIGSMPRRKAASLPLARGGIVLLALLHLGIRDIHLGPTLPAFLSPNVVKVLVDNFGIAGISTVEDDIELFMSEVVA